MPRTPDRTTYPYHLQAKIPIPVSVTRHAFYGEDRVAPFDLPPVSQAISSSHQGCGPLQASIPSCLQPPNRRSLGLLPEAYSPRYGRQTLSVVPGRDFLSWRGGGCGECRTRSGRWLLLYVQRRLLRELGSLKPFSRWKQLAY